ncbi:4597_t:CDS:2 [Gigaspora margarita]|uniref:4597_t:CDS:1 n=1 Tax=Gigaspora margarita TaxID=4874 RepID=A0ABN7W598_GIGMA|nr:4597_t:CDS:2 [Gigaspora margarita]
MSNQYNLESHEAVHNTTSTNVKDEASRKRGFDVIKDHVHREEDVIRRRTYICEHRHNYETNSKKETSTKKILCSWHVNASCLKAKKPNSAIFINTIVDEHNHHLSVDAITFETEKKFSNALIIQYTRRIYHPTTMSLMSNATHISNWLDLQKEKYPPWVIAKGWNNDNTLTHLTWMT